MWYLGGNFYLVALKQKSRFKIRYLKNLKDFFLMCFISPTHKRTEGRAPVWGSEFTSKRRRTTGGDPAETAVGW